MNLRLITSSLSLPLGYAQPWTQMQLVKTELIFPLVSHLNSSSYPNPPHTHTHTHTLSLSLSFSLSLYQSKLSFSSQSWVLPGLQAVLLLAPSPPPIFLQNTMFIQPLLPTLHFGFSCLIRCLRLSTWEPNLAHKSVLLDPHTTGLYINI